MKRRTTTRRTPRWLRAKAKQTSRPIYLSCADAGDFALVQAEAAADGDIKALWIVCTNPAQSLPNQAAVREALQAAFFGTADWMRNKGG